MAKRPPAPRRCTSCSTDISALPHYFSSCRACFREREEQGRQQMAARAMAAERQLAQPMPAIEAQRLQPAAWSRLETVLATAQHHDRELVQRMLRWAQSMREQAAQGDD